jgi:hypothetical protein
MRLHGWILFGLCAAVVIPSVALADPGDVETITVPATLSYDQVVTSKTMFEPEHWYAVTVSGVVNSRSTDPEGHMTDEFYDPSWCFGSYRDGAKLNGCNPQLEGTHINSFYSDDPKGSDGGPIGDQVPELFTTQYTRKGAKHTHPSYRPDHHYAFLFDNIQRAGTLSWSAEPNGERPPRTDYSGGYKVRIEEIQRVLRVKFEFRQQGLPQKPQSGLVAETFQAKGSMRLTSAYSGGAHAFGRPTGTAVLHEDRDPGPDRLITLRLVPDGIFGRNDQRKAVQLGATVRSSDDSRCPTGSKGRLTLVDNARAKPDVGVLEICNRDYRWERTDPGRFGLSIVPVVG